MSTATKIEWCDSTWNPISGCTPISEGCQHCYASAMVKRFPNLHGGLAIPFSMPLIHRDRLEAPLHWRKPRRIFVGSMTDMFHEDVKTEWIVSVLKVIAACPQHIFLFLSKRPERMRVFFQNIVDEKIAVSAETTCSECAPHKDASSERISASQNEVAGNGRVGNATPPTRWNDGKRHCSQIRNDKKSDIGNLLSDNLEAYLNWPFPKNLWLGVTVESAKHLDRLDILRTIPAAKRFVSFEPMIDACRPFSYHAFHDIDLSGIGWVIVGCETGPNARPFSATWARMMLDQCRRKGIPFFMKKATPRDRSIDDLPADLRIREIPR
jgi:protein gp37